MFAVAAFTWGCVYTFGDPLLQASDALVGFVLGQVTIRHVSLDVGSCGLDDCIHDGFNSDTLVSSDISNTLAGLAGCLKYVFTNT